MENLYNSFFFSDYIFFYFTILAVIGFYAFFLVDRHLIVLLMAIEMIFLVLSLMFTSITLYIDDLSGNVFAFFILGVAAVESVIGLSLLLIFYRLRSIITIDVLTFLKG